MEIRLAGIIFIFQLYALKQTARRRVFSPSAWRQYIFFVELSRVAGKLHLPGNRCLSDVSGYLPVIILAALLCMKRKMVGFPCKWRFGGCSFRQTSIKKILFSSWNDS